MTKQTSKTHTHRGHCQVCLRVQALDNITGLVALHGYTVDHGMFSGRCPGSEQISLHSSRVIADSIILAYTTAANESDALVKALKAGTKHPAKAKSGKYGVVEHFDRHGRKYNSNEMLYVPFKGAPEHYQREAVEQAVYSEEQDARHARSHAKTMTEWAARICDAKHPPYDITLFEAHEWKAGDVVRVGGKKGADVAIEEIAPQEYRTHSMRYGSTIRPIPHAKVTLPAVAAKVAKTGTVISEARPARTFWEPLRNLKAPVNATLEALKKAGLL